MKQKIKKTQDNRTKQVFKVLKKWFPSLPNDIDKVVYRYNPGSIRVRLVDDSFRGKSYSERELTVAPALDSLPPSVLGDITLLLLLTPEEVQSADDLMSLEFDDPGGSRL